MEKETETEKEAEGEEAKNKGKLLIDATCTPADISYPTDLKLLNEAREKLEEIIDVLHEPHKGEQKKVRTYRQKARKEYLKVAKKRRTSKQTIRAGIRKQLHYIARNLRHMEVLSRCEKFGQKSLLTSLKRHTLSRVTAGKATERSYRIPETSERC